MSDIIFTERMKTVMKRWLTIQYPKCVKILTEIQTKRCIRLFNKFDGQDSLESLKIDNVKIIIDLFKNWECEDEDEDGMSWENIELCVRIFKDEREKSSPSYANFKEHGQSLDKLLEKIDALDKWEYCTDCGDRVAVKDGFCGECYPWVTTQEEDCCVCMDNSPKVWSKLPCGHILHQSCFIKMIGTKCPLCRAENGYSRVKI